MILECDEESSRMVRRKYKGVRRFTCHGCRNSRWKIRKINEKVVRKFNFVLCEEIVEEVKGE